MKILLQRVSHSAVEVEGECLGKIDAGIMALVGFGSEDEEDPPLQKMCDKLIHLRIFPDENGRFDKSVTDIAGGILLIPQFTLYAQCEKGRRPDFFSALKPSIAEKYFLEFYNIVQAAHPKTEKGKFGADMKVSLLNDGPVTINLEM